MGGGGGMKSSVSRAPDRLNAGVFRPSRLLVLGGLALLALLLPARPALAQTPTVTGVRIFDSPSGAPSFVTGNPIAINVTFSHGLNISGNSRLALTIGSTTRQAIQTTYHPGATRTTVAYSSTILAADGDADGISIAASALTLNGATLRRAGSTTNANLAPGSHAISNSANHKVNVPFVNALTISSSPASGDTYETGENIDVQVGFTRAATVTGTPQLALTIGDNTRQANYTSGTGTTTLTFHYTVQALGPSRPPCLSAASVEFRRARVRPPWVNRRRGWRAERAGRNLPAAADSAVLQSDG